MITVDGTFAQRLSRLIAEEKNRQIGHLISGAAQSLEDYKSRVAELRLLDSVIEWMNKIETDINRGD